MEAKLVVDCCQFVDLIGIESDGEFDVAIEGSDGDELLLVLRGTGSIFWLFVFDTWNYDDVALCALLY